jgi:hypothetical protein
MAIVRRFLSKAQTAYSLKHLRNLALILLFAAMPAWAQSVQLTGANVSPMEGPAFGSDTVLVYATGLQGTTTTTATVTTDVNWIRVTSTANFSTTMNIQNGPNRVQFVFAANSGAAQSGHIVVQPAGGGSPVTITVSQAAAGAVPAGPVPLVTSVSGPKGIDVDSQGNVYFAEATGSNLYQWTAATQQLTTLATKSAKNIFVDVAVDGIGDVFALENTPDGKFNTQVEAIAGPDWYLTLLTGHLIFTSNDIKYSFPAGICVDAAGRNLNVTAIGVSNKCLIDQFGSVYELDSVDDFENIGSFASAPTNAQYASPPVGRTFFPFVTDVDSCGNQLTGVSGSLYGLAKDGSGFIYFTDHGGLRLNRYDPTTPWFTCAPPNSIAPSYTSFTTVRALTVNAFNLAADLTGNIYLSEMPFSRIEEIPRAYVSSAGPINMGVDGGSQTIQIWPATQSLTGVFAPISSDTTWLTVTEAANGVVNFSVSPNSGQSRTGTLTVLGVPIQVVQAESQTPQAMTIISGNNQTATVAAPFATNLLVKVTNQWGDPSSGVTVNFVWPGQNIPVVTDLRGYAAVNGVNAYAAGPNTVTASIQGTGLSQVFLLKGYQNGISVFSGSNQSVPTNQPFAALTVQVLDANGQPLAQVPVTFSAPASGASGTFAASNTATVTLVTGGNGIASSGTFQANATAGSYQVTASISGGGVSGLPSTCVFNLTNYAQLQLLVGDQTTVVNNLFPNKLGVKVVDSLGNPVSGAQVTFVSGDGQGAGAVFLDGTVSNSIATGGDGMARSQEMIATPNTGTFTASATVVLPNGGGTLTANWKLTNVLSTIFSGAVQDAVTTRTLTQPFIVQASSTATAGTMTFTVIPGSNGAGGSFNGQNSVTVNLDPQGYGISPLLTANGQTGQFTVNAYDGVTTVPSTVTSIPCIGDRASVSNSSDNDLWGADLYSLRYLAAYVCAGTNLDLSPIAGSTIKLKSRLRIDDNLTISGPATGTVTIDGGNQTRLFFIGNGAVTMSNLTLQNGLAKGGASAYGGGGAGMGGAIFMQGGSLTLSNMTFTGNRAVGGSVGLGDLGLAGGGGFAGDAQQTAQGGGQGGPSGDLFGLPGFLHGAPGDAGAGGSGGGWNVGDYILSGGNGGFGAGGGGGRYAQKLNSSGNGGFGGGGGYGILACSPIPSCGLYLAPGTGGYGAGNGYATNIVSQTNFGGAGAGFGGAIFVNSGQLALNGVEFNNNSAVAGQLGGTGGDGGDTTLDGQGKGGALFIYNGAIVLNNGATFGTQGPANIAADAGQPGHGNSAAPYVNGATCPGQDTADVCGLFGSTSAVTVTVPAGTTFFINGVGYSGSQTLNLPQAQYTLTAPSPLATGATSQLAFASWSDGGAPTHTITVGPTGLSITGTFVTQYLLTTSAAGTGGSAAPASGYFTAGSAVNLNALATPGSAFANWTGAVAAAGSAATTVTMSGPQTVIANFVTATLVNVQVPTGVSFTLNGANYTGSQFVPLAPGQYALSAPSPQSSTTGGQQIVFNSWSDGGALSHTITVGSSALSITGNFTTQYQLTASATSGGTISSVNGFYNPATIVTLTATPNPGYVFHNWSGMVAATSSASTTITMNQAATVTANFWLAPSACVAAPANLTAWWKGEGTSNDETTLYTAVGSFNVSAGLVGNAFGFSKQLSSFLSFPAGVFPSQPGNGAFSFEAWFQTSQGGVILGQQDSAAYGTPQNGWSPAIYVGTDGNLYVEMFYSGTVNQTVSPVVVNDNQWHHVAVTYDGNQEITYLDGASIGQSSSYTQVSNGSPLSYQLGTGYTSNWPATNNGWYTFTGLIDEATTYSRALTGAEVFSIAQAGSYGKCDPVAALSPATLSFPTVTEGFKAGLSSQIKNSGNAPLSISSIALDANDANFTLLTGNPGDCVAGTPVAAGASCSLRVQFAPPGTGSLSGQITITDKSVVDDGVQTLALSGVSVVPGTLILAASPAVTLQADPVLLTATINGNPVPTGTVTFFDATTTLGTARLNGSGVATLTTTALAVGTHSLTAQYSGSKTYAAATSNTAAVTINPSAGPPQAVSVSPNGGSSALTQAFVAQYSDPNGPADLASVRLLFNSTVNGAHACYVQYTPALNLLYLENDGGTGVSAGITPGSQATVSNSQCKLIAAASNYLVSGNSGILFVTITFTSALPTNIYLYAASASGNSGWVQQGTWGVSAGPPAVVSVTPNAGSGLSQTFSAVYSDPNGAADLATVRLLFNSGVSGAHGCYVTYYPATNLLYLENDGGNAALAGIAPGSAGSASNSQCTLSGTGSSYSASGNTATLNLALTFTSTLPENTYLYAAEANATASNSGWIKLGTWGASAGAPTVVSVTPNAGSGATQSFSEVYLGSEQRGGPRDRAAVI